MSETIKHTIEIGNRHYTLVLKINEIDKFNNIQQTIQNKIQELSKSLNISDQQDLLAMAFIQFLGSEQSVKINDTAELNTKIHQFLNQSI